MIDVMNPSVLTDGWILYFKSKVSTFDHKKSIHRYTPNRQYRSISQIYIKFKGAELFKKLCIDSKNI